MRSAIGCRRPRCWPGRASRSSSGGARPGTPTRRSRTGSGRRRVRHCRSGRTPRSSPPSPVSSGGACVSARISRRRNGRACAHQRGARMGRTNGIGEAVRCWPELEVAGVAQGGVSASPGRPAVSSFRHLAVSRSAPNGRCCWSGGGTRRWPVCAAGGALRRIVVAAGRMSRCWGPPPWRRRPDGRLLDGGSRRVLPTPRGMFSMLCSQRAARLAVGEADGLRSECSAAYRAAITALPRRDHPVASARLARRLGRAGCVAPP